MSCCLCLVILEERLSVRVLTTLALTPLARARTLRRSVRVLASGVDDWSKTETCRGFLDYF